MDWIIICCGGCPSYCGMFSHTSGLSPLDTTNDHTFSPLPPRPPAVTIKMNSDITKYGEQNCLLTLFIENHWSSYMVADVSIKDTEGLVFLPHFPNCSALYPWFLFYTWCSGSFLSAHSLALGKLKRNVNLKKNAQCESCELFYWGQNKDCSPGDSTSGSSEKLLQRGSREGQNISWFWLWKSACNQAYIFPETFCQYDEAFH